MALAASFRDPEGFCVAWGDRMLRPVTARGLAEVQAFLAGGFARPFFDQGRIVATRQLTAAAVADLNRHPEFTELVDGREVAAVFEHERIAFPSYPYEWAPEMLYAAGVLTLDLAEAGLAAGWGLTDATPYNVLFRDSQPVFVDLLSFVRRDPHDPVWRAHAQFCRMFLLPLMACKYWGIRPGDILAKRRDGLEAEDVYRLCGPLRRLLPPFLTNVTLPTWLAGSRRAADPSLYRARSLPDPEKARFILESLFRRLRRALRSVRPALAKATAWSGYMETHSYSQANFTAKETFVREALRECQPRRVLDVGANTGHFSALAARAGAAVVAIDTDLACVGALWQQAQAEQLQVLPLVVDLSRPSAAKGWRNRESASFLERAIGGFDLVLMLAVLHHLLVTERVPLNEALDLAADLTTGCLVVEFVGPGDPMFQTLARGREALHAGLNRAAFERACQRRFEVVRHLALPGAERVLYLLRKKSP